MLVLKRYKGQSIMIGGDIQIIVDRIENGHAYIAISAPADVSILRKELLQRDGSQIKGCRATSLLGSKAENVSQ